MSDFLMPKARHAEFRDAETLSAIDRSTWGPTVTPAPLPSPDSPFFDDKTDPSNTLIAEDGGKVLGYVVLHQSIPLPSHSHVLEISGLAVDPLHQGRGVGRFLIQWAKVEAQRRGAAKLSLRVLSPNEPARRLYESCGFSIEGILRDEFVLAGQRLDDILMACRLKSSTSEPLPMS